MLVYACTTGLKCCKCAIEHVSYTAGGGSIDAGPVLISTQPQFLEEGSPVLQWVEQERGGLDPHGGWVGSSGEFQHQSYALL